MSARREKVKRRAESNIGKNNAIIADLIADCQDSADGNAENICFGKVVKKLGNGRVEAVVVRNDKLEVIQCVVKKFLCGKGVRIETGSVVVVDDGNVGINTIIAVPDKRQIISLNVDNRLIEDEQIDLFDYGADAAADSTVNIDEI